MKLLVIIILISGLFLSAGYAQVQGDSITIEKKSYIYKGEKLTLKELSNITRSNPDAYNAMKKAKSNATGANIFGYIGGFMIGWPLGTAIGGGDPNWAIAGIGAGLALISIPFVVNANKHTKNAVDIYNRDLNKTGYLNSVEYYFQVSKNGAGIKMVF